MEPEPQLEVDPWRRMIASARFNRPTTIKETPPLGFATRVVAQWSDQRKRQLARLLKERLALRFAFGALAMALVSFAWFGNTPSSDAILLPIPNIDIPQTLPNPS